MPASNKIKCIAIDDEPLALDVISKFCERAGGLELSVFTDPAEGLQAILKEQPGIVFLDIEMGGISGLDIAARLPEKSCFIFTTAYLDYALDGFELDAVDYLHKPFAYARFRTALGKALRRLGADDKAEAEAYIVVKKEYSNVTIPYADIVYIEAMEGYVKIFRTDGECVVSRVILKNIGDRLPAADFLRIHRSYIVSRSKVRRFSRTEVELAGGVVLPVGRQYAADVVKNLSEAH